MTPSPTQTRISPYWRSLDELENSAEFQEFVQREFPQAADQLPEGVSRRRWMQIMGASFTLAAAQGCRWKTETIAPFAERPDDYVPGTITKYATSIDWAGAPRHLLVSKYDGRPIMVSGNPEHPASRSGSDPFSQAATLSLYDPDRQGKPIERRDGKTKPQGWEEVDAMLEGLAKKLVASGGAGLAVLMQPNSSIALSAATAALFKKFPQAKLAQYAPLGRENELAGAQMAFGQPVRTHYDLKKADIVACFDCNLLEDHPESNAISGDWASRRDPDGKMNRLYCVESQFSTTGTVADHRLPLKSSAITGALAKLLERVQGNDTASAPADEEHAAGPSEDEFLAALAEDLLAAKGKGIVCVGQSQTPEAHALANQINAVLENAGQTVLYTAEPKPVVDAMSMADLVGEIAAQRVDTLLILGGNPIYDAPADLDLAKELEKVETAIHLSPYDDETSQACHWSLPETHPFESWGDASAWDGTVCIQQPLIDPLLNGRSALELVNQFAGQQQAPREFVRQAIEEKIGPFGSDENWNRLLHDGLMTDAKPEMLGALPVKPFEVAPGEPVELELVFTASDSSYDGRLANNGWLQETPNSLTKLTWDNAALMSPATAAQIGLGKPSDAQGSMIEVAVGHGDEQRTIKLPVFLLPGTAKGSIGVALGYGRTAAGRVGGLLDEKGQAVPGLYPDGLKATWFTAPAEPVGVDAYKIRTTDAMAFVTQDLSIKPVEGSYLLATTQDHHAIDVGGLTELSKRSIDFVREASQEHYQEHHDFAQHFGHHIETEDLWNEPTFNRQDDGEKKESVTGNAWGMTIDLNKCLGCTACSIACQAENNIPVVGKDMVSRGREMHWIRIDRYFRNEGGEFSDNPSVVHQPVACQQCETAPCEQVCPVAATVHSDEGLNDMTYNRCIGTRYCANNCPFKVRRFNYYHYNWELDRQNWPAVDWIGKSKVNPDRQLQQLVINPEVTVRHRGVMEKCTYCVQRISAARIDAKVEGRELRDGDIVVACQESCTTNAITFGDLNDPNSKVAKAHANSRSYGMLDGLHLRPRTKYLARIRNPHPKLKKYVPADPEVHGHGHGGDHTEGHGDENGHEEEKHA